MANLSTLVIFFCREILTIMLKMWPINTRPIWDFYLLNSTISMMLCLGLRSSVRMWCCWEKILFSVDQTDSCCVIHSFVSTHSNWSRPSRRELTEIFYIYDPEDSLHWCCKTMWWRHLKLQANILSWSDNQLRSVKIS